MDFYKFVKAYDLVFSGRNYEDECKFVEWCYGEQRLTDILEIACGPAHHARYLAKKGYSVSALDLSKDMLKYASDIAKQEGVDMNFIYGDMIKWELTQKFDLILNFNESVTHILTNDDFLTHLNTIYNSLNAGGVYIIETAHPFYFFPDNEPNRYTITDEGTEVTLLFGKPDDDYDPVSQIWNLSTEVIRSKDGKVLESEKAFSRHRWYLAQELDAIIKLSGLFKKHIFYGSMTLPPPALTDEDADSMVILLFK